MLTYRADLATVLRLKMNIQLNLLKKPANDPKLQPELESFQILNSNRYARRWPKTARHRKLRNYGQILQSLIWRVIFFGDSV